MELIAGRKTLAEIQRGIFHVDALSILLSHILRKCIRGYKSTKSLEMINQLLYEDDIKHFVENEKELENPIQMIIIYRQDIGMEFGKKMRSENDKKTVDIELLNQARIRTLGEKETYKYLVILEADTIKQAEIKEKLKKASQTSKKTSAAQISSKGATT